MGHESMCQRDRAVIQILKIKAKISESLGLTLNPNP